MRRRSSLLTALIVLIASAVLASCGGIDARQTNICMSLISVVEPPGTPVTVVKIMPDATTVDRVVIAYRTTAESDAAEGEPAQAAAASGTIERSIACRFSGTGFDEHKDWLRDVVTQDGPMSQTRLDLINHRWLTDLEAQSEALLRTKRTGEAALKGFVTLGPAAGYFLQQFVNAAPSTALYALLALAYSLVYGLTNRINLAFGDIATLGAYGAFLGVTFALGLGLPAAGAALPLALLAAVAFASASGSWIGKTVFVPLVGRSSQPLLVATIGLAVVLQEFLARAQGVHELWLNPVLAEPHILAGGSFEVVATTMQLAVASCTAIVVVALIAAMRLTRYGRIWRSVADDRKMAGLLGVDARGVIIASFAIASALAGLGGAVLTLHFGGTSFAMGTTVGLKALVAAIVGGVGSLPGAVLGGLIIGLTEAFWSAYEPIVWRDGVIFTLMIVFLVLRPEGLMGTRRAIEEREDRP
ncbi:MAG: branched-chain amino acid ABC transporter permease [Ancalomicrobiaceae bacterium]|nr:branched-chain amino acid ABC transporter permease [Ancalomicrobiaceae bacterium]